MSIRYEAWRLNRRAPLTLAAVGIWLLGSACSDTSHRLGGAQAEARVDPDALTPCARGELLEPIDDMEDGDGSIDFTAGRAGVWFAFNDHTGTQVPDIFAERFQMSALEPPRGDSQYAAHTTGSGFREWGAGIGLDLRVQQPYDASSYAGISFWARRGPGAPLNLQLAMPDYATSPLGGKCDDAAGLCHDDFGAELELSEEFQQFTVPWQEMVARNWSEMSLPGIDTARIYGLRFQVEAESFDFWIDDVSFLCRDN